MQYLREERWAWTFSLRDVEQSAYDQMIQGKEYATNPIYSQLQNVSCDTTRYSFRGTLEFLQEKMS